MDIPVKNMESIKYPPVPVNRIFLMDLFNRFILSGFVSFRPKMVLAVFIV